MDKDKTTVKSISKIFDNFYFKLSVSGILMFVCAFFNAPSAGVLRTIPFFAIGGACIGLLSLQIGLSAAFCAVMTLCAYLVSGRSVGEALLFTAVAEILLFIGIYIVKLAKIFKKNKDGGVRKKCVVLSAVALISAFVVSAVLCGNTVSFAINDFRNTKYINKYYGKDVEKRYTSYEVLNGGYKTYVSFKDGDYVFGNEDECFIKKENGAFSDGVRDYYEVKMLMSAEDEIAGIISKATSGFNVVMSDIDFENGEILDGNSDVNKYIDRISYVISFDVAIKDGEKDKFVSICKETVDYIQDSNVAFKEIVLCGGNTDEAVWYTLTVKPGKDAFDVEKNVCEFNEKQIGKYGVTEEDILNYWKNK